MAAPPAEVPAPYTYEEALLLFQSSQRLKPMISMDQYGTVAFFLLLIAFLLTGLFSISKDKITPSGAIAAMILAVPASIFFGFGVVWLFLAVGVYV